MSKPKPKPLPICALPGCDQRVKRPEYRFCCNQHALEARRNGSMPPVDEIKRVAVAERIGTMQGLADRFEVTIFTMKKHLSRNGMRISEIRKPIETALLAENPKLTAAEVLQRMGCKPGTWGEAAPKAGRPAGLSGQAVEIMQARSILQADARSIVEYWQTPECDRWLFADEVREAAERRMRR